MRGGGEQREAAGPGCELCLGLGTGIGLQRAQAVLMGLHCQALKVPQAGLESGLLPPAGAGCIGRLVSSWLVCWSQSQGLWLWLWLWAGLGKVQ